MNKNILNVGIAALFLTSHVQAVVIDKATFKANGGDLGNVAVSIRTHNDVLRKYGNAAPWRAVGQLEHCTATWLGDKNGVSYFLTAAQCVKYYGTATPIESRFTAADGRVIAAGRGMVYVPWQRVMTPPWMRQPSTDVAIVELPSRHPMLDEAGQPLEQPILNDRKDEKDLDVIFVGYGSWGVGTNTSGDFGPLKGDRRLYGRSRIVGMFDHGYGIRAGFRPAGPSPTWARVVGDDAGSAWWQFHDGKPVIVATTNGGSAGQSTGTRIAKYVDWIRTIYPGARMLSSETPMGCIVSMTTGARYCMKPGQENLYALPSWIYAHPVRVDAAPGTAVVLGDYDNVSYNRLAKFVGTVENEDLKSVKAFNGMTLDFSKPHSMKVWADTTPLGCIVSLSSGERYCLPAGQRSHYTLPAWIDMQPVQVEAAPGLAVMLSDWANLSYNRVATFPGRVQNWELHDVEAWNGSKLNFTLPHSMRVVQQ